MSTTPVTPTPPTSSTLDKILNDAEIALTLTSEFGALVPGVGTAAAAFAAIAAKILSVAKAAVQAHESITGQPLDVTTLHHIDPIP